MLNNLREICVPLGNCEQQNEVTGLKPEIDKYMVGKFLFTLTFQTQINYILEF